MSADSNKCDTAFSVYNNREHVKVINDEPESMGSAAEFCGAFYHVPRRRTIQRVCLDEERCSITTGKNATEYSQPKTAVDLVKFKLRQGDCFHRRYTNCFSKKNTQKSIS